ncbi:MAG: tetratricopeptide repeat protein [Candidatus Omnitrophica bacterium]|nr:tetratricopeptide repeat protein [Candidatus Omnitrophota bacterium]
MKTRNKIIIIFVIFLASIFFGISVYKNQTSKDRKNAILLMGLTKGQKDYFQDKLLDANKIENLIRKGKNLQKEGKYVEAIQVFEEIYKKSKWSGDKGSALLHIADAYEKMQDYKKALKYVVIDRDEYVNDWAKAPIVERAKYLEYAAQGNYEMALKYAKQALEVETNMPYNKGIPSQGYVDRLNDLIASKDYILSLKKE